MPKFRSLPVSLIFFLACFSAGAETNFGSVNRDSEATEMVTVTVPSATSFTAINVVTQGSTNVDFLNAGGGTCALGVTYAAGQSCTVGVTFRPRLSGLRMGAVVLHSSATNVFATAYVQGIGVGPEVAFDPSLRVAIGGQAPSYPPTISYPEYSAVAFGNPKYPAIDGSNNLFVYDSTISASSIYKIPVASQASPAHPSILTAKGPTGDTTGSPIQAIVVDGSGNRIIVGRNVAFSMPAGSSTGQEYTDSYGGPATGANFTAAAVDGAGDLFLLDQAYNDVIEFPNGNSQASPIHHALSVDGNPLANPSGLAVDISGNLFVSDTGNNRVVEFPTGGGTPIVIAPTVNGKGLNSPGCLAFDGTGALLICDQNNDRVVEAPSGDAPSTAIAPVVNGVAMGSPWGIAIDPFGYLYIADPGNARVLQILRGFPPSLSFAETTVGATSTDSPQVIQVQNIGNASFAFTDLIYPQNFFPGPVSPDACTSSTSLGAGEFCNLSISFTPQVSGNFVGAVDLRGTSFNQLSIPVSGLGAFLQFSTHNLSYGTITVGKESASQQVTLTNTGSEPVLISGVNVAGANASSFVFGSTCTASLAMGASCVIHGHFAPTTAGALSATININYLRGNSGEWPQSITLTGTGQNPPVATLSSTSLSFGSLQTGTTGGSQQVTLTNTGGADLTISGIAITGPNASSFVFGNDCSPILPPSGSCTIHGHFAPTVAGALSATITITDNASGSPQQIALTGTGTSTAVTTVSVSPSVLNFGNQVVGRGGNSQIATLTNTGSGTLTVNSVQITGPNHSSFSFNASCGQTLAPGASCALSGHFTPMVLGLQTASIVYNVNLAGPPPTISLTGTGVSPPAAKYSATQINFGSVAVGQSSASQNITLTNTGGAPLHVGNIAVNGANASSYGFASDCGTLAVNASCTIHGHFAPTTTGPLNATLFIFDDASPGAEDTEQTITLTGAGQ